MFSGGLTRLDALSAHTNLGLSQVVKGIITQNKIEIYL